MIYALDHRERRAGEVRDRILRAQSRSPDRHPLRQPDAAVGWFALEPHYWGMP
jgi:hypothetical protein